MNTCPKIHIKETRNSKDDSTRLYLGFKSAVTQLCAISREEYRW